jgi:quercetin dioxygenase-like cupin family protein
MNTLQLLLSTTMLAACSAVACTTPQYRTPSAATASVAHVEIIRAGAQAPSKGPAANFTGSVVVTPLFQATASTRASGVSVTFEPGARSAWHSHPAGQTLIVTAGTGWVQEWGGKKQAMKPGDVVWTPPGVKHWHGATETEAMTHLAILEHVNGKVVDWMEQVSDQQYRE